MRSGGCRALACVCLFGVAALRAQERGAFPREPGLESRKDIIFCEDFEADGWKRRWAAPDEKSTVTEERDCVFRGRRSLRVRAKAGEHGTDGWHRIVFGGPPAAARR